MLVHVWFHTGGPFNSYFHHGSGIVLVPELLVLQHPRSFPIRIISFQAGRLTATSLAELNIGQVTMGNHRWICDNLIMATPIGSMYGIYANIWGKLMVNVTIYGIHGSYGIVNTKPSSFGILDFDPKPSQLRWHCASFPFSGFIEFMLWCANRMREIPPDLCSHCHQALGDGDLENGRSNILTT